MCAHHTRQRRLLAAAPADCQSDLTQFMGGKALTEGMMVDDGGMVPDEYSNMINPEEDTFTDPGNTPYKPKLRGNQHLYE